MKIGLKVATVLGLAFVAMLVLNFGLRLMSKPNDMAVSAGVVVLLGLLARVVAVGVIAFKKIDKKFHIVSSIGRNLGVVAVMCLVAGSMVFTTGCNTVIQPGHVGILVNQFWFGPRGTGFSAQNRARVLQPCNGNRFRVSHIRPNGKVDEGSA